MSDLGEAVIKPEVKGVWGGKSRRGGECNFGNKRREVVSICVLPVKASGRRLQERSGKYD